MKTKAKLTLAISIMSAAVLAAGVTSTFAWFTTQNKATLATGTMTVDTVSSITVNVTKLAYDKGTTAVNFGKQTTSASDAGVTLGPVSSVDGDKFYAPMALNDGTVAYGASNMDEVTDKVNWKTTKKRANDYVGYVKYGIHVEAGADTGTARTLKFKIAVTASDKDAAEGKTYLDNSYRVAFMKADSTYAAGDAIGIYSKTARVSTGTDNKGWYDSSTTTTPSLTTKQYVTTAITSVKDPVSLDVTTANAISEYYILSVWVEGADADATNDKIAGKELDTTIEFSLE